MIGKWKTYECSKKDRGGRKKFLVRLSMAWSWLMLMLLVMMGERKTVPPQHPAGIYAFTSHPPSSRQRIVNNPAPSRPRTGRPTLPPSPPMPRLHRANRTLRRPRYPPFRARVPSTADAMAPKRRRPRLACTLDIDPGAINVVVAGSAPPIVADPKYAC